MYKVNARYGMFPYGIERYNIMVRNSKSIVEMYVRIISKEGRRQENEIEFDILQLHGLPKDFRDDNSDGVDVFDDEEYQGFLAYIDEYADMLNPDSYALFDGFFRVPFSHIVNLLVRESGV